MIEVAGIHVPRAGMIEVAHRLVLAGEVQAAGRVLEGLVQGDRITLTAVDRAAVLQALEDPPPGLSHLRAVLTEHVAPVETDSHEGAKRRDEPAAAPVRSAVPDDDATP